MAQIPVPQRQPSEVSAGGYMLKKSCAIAGPVQTFMMKGELAKANINARLGKEEESAMMISSVKNRPLFIRD